MSPLPVDPYKRLLFKGEDSDFTIKCQGIQFRVHKLLLKNASTFFRAACDSRFKEHYEACVDLPEDDPGILAHALEFIYLHRTSIEHAPQFEYLTGAENETLGDFRKEIEAISSVTAADTYVANSVNYMDYPLMSPAQCSATVAVTARLYQLADKLGMDRVKEQATGLFYSKRFESIADSGLAKVLQVIYDSTAPDDIKSRARTTDHFIRRYGRAGLDPAVVYTTRLVLSSMESTEHWMTRPL